MSREKQRRLISDSLNILITGTGVCITLWLFLAACGGNNVLPATSHPSNPTFPSIIPTETRLSPVPIYITPTATCFTGLVFLSDATIPDYSIVAPSIFLDKQWLVLNSGTCNWDSRYRLRMIGGKTMGASPEQALYPIRAGMQALLRIVFTAPFEPGEYYSQWQAFDPMGNPFGESFLIRIIVQ